LKPGQTLRLGQVELKLEVEGMAATAPSAPTIPAVPAKKPLDATMVMPRGVSLDQLEKGGRPPGFDGTTVFTKKSNKVNKFFIIGGIIAVIVIVVLLFYALQQVAPTK
jgi:hypothetical protein